MSEGFSEGFQIVVIFLIGVVTSSVLTSFWWYRSLKGKTIVDDDVPNRV